MREFLFSLVYSSGIDAYVDAFIENESLRSEAVISCLDNNKFWRIERVTGESEALDRLDSLLLDETLDRESISTRACRSARQHSLLEADSRSRVVYTLLSDVSYCDAVPFIAVQYLTGGTVFEVVREQREARWRILMQNDEKIGMVYDTIGARLADGIEFEFGHLEDATGWQNELLSSRQVRSEQQQVLELAVDRGYFETPREVTLDELADELDIPRSTVSYRLRRATAELAKGYVEEEY